ncbi:TraU family protein [Escherichia coli]|uniref:TraU family protein n=1 Tax=Escherichia coli TaxID=562 RepID=UPI00162A7283
MPHGCNHRTTATPATAGNRPPAPVSASAKERWRYQMVNMYPDSGQCHPFGRSVMRWETGKNPPNTKKNFGYLMWRKRNCVFL